MRTTLLNNKKVTLFLVTLLVIAFVLARQMWVQGQVGGPPCWLCVDGMCSETTLPGWVCLLSGYSTQEACAASCGSGDGGDSGGETIVDCWVCDGMQCMLAGQYSLEGCSSVGVPSLTTCQESCGGGIGGEIGDSGGEEIPPSDSECWYCGPQGCTYIEGISEEDCALVGGHESQDLCEMNCFSEEPEETIECWTCAETFEGVDCLFSGEMSEEACNDLPGYPSQDLCEPNCIVDESFHECWSCSGGTCIELGIYPIEECNQLSGHQSEGDCMEGCF